MKKRVIHEEDLVAWLRPKADSGELYQQCLKKETLSTPIHLPVHSISRNISPDNFQKLSDWIAEWNFFQKRFPNTIGTERKRIAQFGIFSLPSQLTIPAEKAAVLIGRSAEATCFGKAVRMTREEAPFLTEWVAGHPKWFRNAGYLDKLPSFLRVGKWMRDRHVQEEAINSLREAAIPGVDTKFLERNMTEARDMLKFLNGAQAVSRQDFLDAIGVEKYPEDGHFVKIRMPDSNCRIGNLSVISVLCSELNRLPLQPKTIFLVENKATFYHFPAVKNSIVLFGSGYAATGQLRDIPFLREAQCFYWSDLDHDGFRMLDYLRSQYPHLQSLFMDIEATREAISFVVPDDGTKDVSPQFLTESEQEAFDFLSQTHQRIEQERFPWQFAKDWLRRHGFTLLG